MKTIVQKLGKSCRRWLLALSLAWVGIGMAGAAVLDTDVYTMTNDANDHYLDFTGTSVSAGNYLVMEFSGQPNVNIYKMYWSGGDKEPNSSLAAVNIRWKDNGTVIGTDTPSGKSYVAYRNTGSSTISDYKMKYKAWSLDDNKNKVTCYVVDDLKSFLISKGMLFYIKDINNNKYLYPDGESVYETETKNDNCLWFYDVYYNATDKYILVNYNSGTDRKMMHMENQNGTIQYGYINPNYESELWFLNVSGTNTAIRNAWKTDRYIYIDGTQAKYNTTNNVMWQLEFAPADPMAGLTKLAGPFFISDGGNGTPPTSRSGYYAYANNHAVSMTNNPPSPFTDVYKWDLYTIDGTSSGAKNHFVIKNVGTGEFMAASTNANAPFTLVATRSDLTTLSLWHYGKEGGDGHATNAAAAAGLNNVNIQNVVGTEHKGMNDGSALVKKGSSDSDFTGHFKFTLVPAAPANPTGLTAAAASSSSITLNWTASAGATGYTVYKSTDNTNWDAGTAVGNVTSYTSTGLSASTTYYYKVAATNEGGVSSGTASVNATTLPNAPTGLTATANSASQITLNWTASDGATGYKVYDNNGTQITTNITINGTTAVITGLTANTSYTYKVKATNTGGDSDFSSTASATTCAAAPTGLAISGATHNSVTLSWTEVVGATGYKVYDSGDNEVASVNTNTATISNLSAYTRYTYYVKAEASCTSPESDNITVRTQPAPLASFVVGAAEYYRSTVNVNYDYNAATDMPKTGAHINDEAPANPDTRNYVGDNGYREIVANNPNAYTETAKELTVYHNVGGIEKANNNERYAVYRINPAVTGKYKVTLLHSFNAVSANLYTNTCGAAKTAATKLNETVLSATLCPQGNAPNSWTNYCDYSTVVDLTAGPQDFIVEWVNTSFNMWTIVFESVPVPAAPTGLTATANSASQITLSWTASDGATGYKVYDNSGNQITTNITIDGTTAVISGLTANTSYTYKVKATNVGGDSDFSSTASATTCPTAPTGNVITATPYDATHVDVSWTPAAGSGAVQYYVYAKGSEITVDNKGTNKTGNQYQSLGADSARITLNNSATHYWFTVTVRRAGCGESMYPVADTYTKPTTPTGLSATANSASQITLTWSVVTNAGTYLVYSSASENGEYTLVSPPLNDANVLHTNSFTHTGLTSNTTYYYKVVAVAAGSDVQSAMSAAVSATTLVSAPTLSVSGTTASSVTLAWTDFPGQTYDVYRSAYVDGNYKLLASSQSNGYVDYAVFSGSKYYYQLKVNGADDWSNKVNGTTVFELASPSVSITNKDVSKVTIGWTAVPNAGGYRIYRSLDGENYTYTAFTSTTSYTDDVNANASNYEAKHKVYYYKVTAVEDGMEQWFFSGRASNIDYAGCATKEDSTAVASAAQKPFALYDYSTANGWTSLNPDGGGFKYINGIVYKTLNDGVYHTVGNASTGHFSFTETAALTGEYKLDVFGAVRHDMQDITGLTFWLDTDSVKASNRATAYVLYNNVPYAPVCATCGDNNGWQNYLPYEGALPLVAGSNKVYYYVGSPQNVMKFTLTAGESDFSKAVPVEYVPQPVRRDPTINSMTSSTINWDAIEGVSGYKIRFSTDYECNGNGKHWGIGATGEDANGWITVNTNSYTISPMSPTLQYRYQLKAIGALGTESKELNDDYCWVSLRVYAPVLTTSVTGQNITVTISDSKASEIKDYTLYYSKDRTNWTNVTVTKAASSYTLAGDPATLYFFKATATDNATDSISMPSVTVWAQTEEMVPVLTLTGNVLTWTAISNATSYNVMRKTDDGEFVSVTTTAGTTYTDNTMDAAHAYMYKVIPTSGHSEIQEVWAYNEDGTANMVPNNAEKWTKDGSGTVYIDGVAYNLGTRRTAGNAGTWMKFTVDAAYAANYSVDAYIAHDRAYAIGNYLSTDGTSATNVSSFAGANLAGSCYGSGKGWQNYHIYRGTNPVAMTGEAQDIYFTNGACNFMKMLFWVNEYQTVGTASNVAGVPAAIGGCDFNIDPTDYYRSSCDDTYKDNTYGNELDKSENCMKKEEMNYDDRRYYGSLDSAAIGLDLRRGSYILGYTGANSWVTYRINAAEAGTYRMTVVATDEDANRKLHLNLYSLAAGAVFDPEHPGDPLATINTTTVGGAWYRDYYDYASGTFSLSAGVQDLVLMFASDSEASSIARIVFRKDLGSLGLTAKPIDDITVRLDWNNLGSGVTYTLERSNDDPRNNEPDGYSVRYTGSSNYFIDNDGPVRAHHYYYRLSAATADCASALTEVVDTVTFDQKVRIIGVNQEKENNETFLSITWSYAVDPNETQPTAYKVYRAPSNWDDDSDFEYKGQQVGSQQFYHDKTVGDNKEYCYKVSAYYGGGGNSSPSSEITDASRKYIWNGTSWNHSTQYGMSASFSNNEVTLSNSRGYSEGGNSENIDDQYNSGDYHVMIRAKSTQDGAQIGIALTGNVGGNMFTYAKYTTVTTEYAYYDLGACNTFEGRTNNKFGFVIDTYTAPITISEAFVTNNPNLYSGGTEIAMSDPDCGIFHLSHLEFVPNSDIIETYQNAPFTAEFTVKNNGSAALSESVVGSINFGATASSTFTVNSLLAGATTTVSAQFTAPAAAGNYTVSAQLPNGETATRTVRVLACSPATAIALDQASATIYTGEVSNTVTLTPTVTPASGYCGTIEWISSDETVATVSNGVVTAVAVGSATITATINGENEIFSADCEITVSTPIAAASVVVSPKCAEVDAVGNTLQLEAVVYASDEETLATDQRVTWTSANTEIATVNSDGLVTGVAIGQTTITAAAIGDGTITATKTFTVKLTPPELTLLTSNYNSLVISWPYGDEVSGYEFTVRNSDGTSTIMTKSVTPTGSVGDEQTVVLTHASFAPSTTYRVQLRAYNNSWSHACTGHESENWSTWYNFATTAAPTALSVNPTVYNMLVGEQAQIGYTVTPEQLADGFTSANPSIATVDALGKITAVAVGTTTITVTAGEHTKTVTVNVQLNQPEFTNVVPDMQSAELTWDKQGAEYVEIYLSEDDCTSPETLVYSGTGTSTTLTGLDVDTRYCVKIRGCSDENCTISSKNYGTASFRTLPAPAMKIRESVYVLVGHTHDVPEITYTPAGATVENLQWTGGDTDIATINETTITGEAVGETVFTATATVNGWPASAQLTVYVIPADYNCSIENATLVAGPFYIQNNHYKNLFLKDDETNHNHNEANNASATPPSPSDGTAYKNQGDVKRTYGEKKSTEEGSTFNDVVSDKAEYMWNIYSYTIGGNTYYMLRNVKTRRFMHTGVMGDWYSDSGDNNSINTLEWVAANVNGATAIDGSSNANKELSYYMFNFKSASLQDGKAPSTYDDVPVNASGFTAQIMSQRWVWGQRVIHAQHDHTGAYVTTNDYGWGTKVWIFRQASGSEICPEIEEIVDVEGFEVAPHETEIYMGMSFTVEKIFTPETATIQEVDWTVKGSSVEVDKYGVVTGVDMGTSTVYATTKDGRFVDSTVVRVLPSCDPMIVYTPVAPAMDGKLDAIWDNAQPKAIMKTAQLVDDDHSKPKNNVTNIPAGFWRLMYDDTNLYVYVQVVKDPATLTTHSDLWHGDAIEFYLYTANKPGTKQDAGANYYSNKLQLGIDCGGKIAIGSHSDPNFHKDHCQHQVVRTATGFDVEFLIPWADFGNIDSDDSPLKKGRIFMEMSVDQTRNGVRDAQVTSYTVSPYLYLDPYYYTEVNFFKLQVPEKYVVNENEPTTIKPDVKGVESFRWVELNGDTEVRTLSDKQEIVINTDKDMKVRLYVTQKGSCFATYQDIDIKLSNVHLLSTATGTSAVSAPQNNNISSGKGNKMSSVNCNGQQGEYSGDYAMLYLVPANTDLRSSLGVQYEGNGVTLASVNGEETTPDDGNSHWVRYLYTATDDTHGTLNIGVFPENADVKLYNNSGLVDVPATRDGYIYTWTITKDDIGTGVFPSLDGTSSVWGGTEGIGPDYDDGLKYKVTYNLLSNCLEVEEIITYGLTIGEGEEEGAAVAFNEDPDLEGDGDFYITVPCVQTMAVLCYKVDDSGSDLKDWKNLDYYTIDLSAFAGKLVKIPFTYMTRDEWGHTPVKAVFGTPVLAGSDSKITISDIPSGLQTELSKVCPTVTGVSDNAVYYWMKRVGNSGSYEISDIPETGTCFTPDAGYNENQDTHYYLQVNDGYCVEQSDVIDYRLSFTPDEHPDIAVNNLAVDLSTNSIVANVQNYGPETIEKAKYTLKYTILNISDETSKTITAASADKQDMQPNGSVGDNWTWTATGKFNFQADKAYRVTATIAFTTASKLVDQVPQNNERTIDVCTFVPGDTVYYTIKNTLVNNVDSLCTLHFKTIGGALKHLKSPEGYLSQSGTTRTLTKPVVFNVYYTGKPYREGTDEVTLFGGLSDDLKSTQAFLFENINSGANAENAFIIRAAEHGLRPEVSHFIVRKSRNVIIENLEIGSSVEGDNALDIDDGKLMYFGSAKAGEFDDANVVVRDCKITANDNATAAVVVSGVSDVILNNNVISNPGSNAAVDGASLKLVNAANIYLLRNNIYGATKNVVWTQNSEAVNFAHNVIWNRGVAGGSLVALFNRADGQNSVGGKLSLYYNTLVVNNSSEVNTKFLDIANAEGKEMAMGSVNGHLLRLWYNNMYSTSLLTDTVWYTKDDNWKIINSDITKNNIYPGAEITPATEAGVAGLGGVADNYMSENVITLFDCGPTEEIDFPLSNCEEDALNVGEPLTTSSDVLLQAADDRLQVGGRSGKPKWTLGAHQADKDAVAVHSIIWTNYMGDNNWDTYANWIVEETMQQLNCTNTFASDLTAIIPAISGSRYMSEDVNLSDGGYYPTLNALPSKVRINENKIADVVEIEYGGALPISKFLKADINSAEHSPRYRVFKTSLVMKGEDRVNEDWILVGPNIRPEHRDTLNGRQMISGDYYKDLLPQVFMHEVVLDTNEGTATWKDPFRDLEVAVTQNKGFAIKAPDRYSKWGYPATTYYKSQLSRWEAGSEDLEWNFTGTLEQDVHAPTFSAEGSKWTLMTNTFMGNIDVAKLIAAQGGQVAVWSFNDGNKEGSTYGSFATHNSSSASGVKIKPQHVFFYYHEGATKNVTLTEDVCDFTTPTTYKAFTQGVAPSYKPTLEIRSLNGRYSSVTSIVYDAYLEEEQLGSKEFNLMKLFTGYAQTPDICSYYGADALYSQTINPSIKEVPLGVKAGEELKAVFEFSGAEDFKEVYLEDRLFGKRYDLKNTESLEFDLTEGYNQGRFYVIFEFDELDEPTTDLNESAASEIRIYTEDNENVVVSSEGADLVRIQMIDMSGKQQNIKVKSDRYNLINMSSYPAGVYTFKASTTDRTKVEKVVIK